MKDIAVERLRSGRRLGLIGGLPIALAVLVVGCGDNHHAVRATPAKQTTATRAGITPYPATDVSPLRSGVTYTTVHFRPALSIPVGPGEWLAGTGDRRDHVRMEVDVGRGQAELAFHHVSEVYDARRGGVTPGDMVAGPRDFAHWLRSHPHLRTTKPVPVDLLGLHGVRIDAVVTSSPRRVPRDCLKITAGTGACVPLFHDGFDFAVNPEDSVDRFYVLGKPGSRPGSQLVVEEWVEPASRFATLVRRLDRQLRSISIAG